MAMKDKLLKAIENGELDEVSSLLEGFNELNETFSKLLLIFYSHRAPNTLIPPLST